jgi:hypothetical protein
LPYRETVRSRLIWGLIGAASLVDGCVLIDYGQRIDKDADAGELEPVDEDGGPDVAAFPDARADARSDAPSDAAVADAAANDAEPDADGSSEAGERDAGDASADASTGDASADASTDSMTACSTLNECGGCATLAKAVGSACGSCGVGRYACDGAEALSCTNDGVPASPGNPALIDDLEDGDQFILSNYGLSGTWYMVADSTAGTLAPPLGSVPVPANVGAVGSARSMHFSASGFTKWGAGMAVSLNAFGCDYDASKQTGIELHIKGSGSMQIQVGTKQTVPVADHGTCTVNCNDLFSLNVNATSNWTLRKIPFANLAQSGWGTPATFRPADVLFVQFAVPPGGSLDVYVDNLSFY